MTHGNKKSRTLFSNSLRQAIRSAFEVGYLQDIDLWVEMLEDRNMTFYMPVEGEPLTGNYIFLAILDCFVAIMV